MIRITEKLSDQWLTRMIDTGYVMLELVSRPEARQIYTDMIIDYEMEFKRRHGKFYSPDIKVIQL